MGGNRYVLLASAMSLLLSSVALLTPLLYAPPPLGCLCLKQPTTEEAPTAGDSAAVRHVREIRRQHFSKLIQPKAGGGNPPPAAAAAPAAAPQPKEKQQQQQWCALSAGWRHSVSLVDELASQRRQASDAVQQALVAAQKHAGKAARAPAATFHFVDPDFPHNYQYIILPNRSSSFSSSLLL